MKVVHQVNNLAVGGVETYVYRLAKYANEETYVFSHKPGVVMDWLKDDGLGCYVGGYHELKHLILEKGIDVIVFHTGSYLPDYFDELKHDFPGIKMIVVLHTIYSANYSLSSDKRIDVVICVSDIVAYAQPGAIKVKVIKPGVEKRPVHIGNVTRIAPYKFIQDMINCSEHLQNWNVPHKITVVGEDAVDAQGYTNEIRKLSTPAFDFPGYLPPAYLNKFFESLDIFYHPIGYEAYPAVLLEAQSYNIPVISYPKGGATEMRGIILVDNAFEAASAIKVIYESVKDIKQCADEFSAVYKEVLE